MDIYTLSGLCQDGEGLGIFEAIIQGLIADMYRGIWPYLQASEILM